MKIDIKDYSSYYSEILSSLTLDQAWTAFQEALKQFGFEKVIYLSSNFTNNKNWGNPKDILILSNHDIDYNNSLFNKKINFLKNHPNFTKLLGNPGCSTIWQKVNIERIENKTVKNLIYLNNQYEINNGIQFSLEQVKPGSACVIMLTGNSNISQVNLNKIWKSKKKEVIVLSKIFRLSVGSLPYTRDSIGPLSKKLTPRQLEILDLLAEGNSIIQISKILNVSIPTIDKHLKLARSNLDVSTSAQAVSKALTEQMLFNTSQNES